MHAIDSLSPEQPETVVRKFPAMARRIASPAINKEAFVSPRNDLGLFLVEVCQQARTAFAGGRHLMLLDVG
jgi:hypothetical protein